jgi:hypothetical protein
MLKFSCSVAKENKFWHVKFDKYWDVRSYSLAICFERCIKDNQVRKKCTE